MNCLICQIETLSIHNHHTIPQHVGGVDSQQVPLCANCHNGVHREIKRLLARFNKKLQLGMIKWTTPRCPTEIETATKVIKIGLEATIAYEATGDTTVKMALALPKNIHTGLTQLKKLGRFSTLEQTVIECIRLGLHTQSIKT